MASTEVECESGCECECECEKSFPGEGALAGLYLSDGMVWAEGVNVSVSVIWRGAKVLPWGRCPYRVVSLRRNGLGGRGKCECEHDRGLFFYEDLPFD